MTLRSHLIGLFPALHLTLIAISIIALLYHLSVYTLLLLIFTVYLFPIICFHLHNWMYPLIEGSSVLNHKEYIPWWGTHQIQSVLNALPAFESILKIVPGAYSMWLRLWGSKIGRNVYWTPRIDIVDRSLMEIKDNVIFGHKVGCYAHVVSKRNDILELYVKKIQIGGSTFIGAGTNIGPGAVIGDGNMLPLLSVVGINQHIKSIIKCENGL